MSSDHSLKGFLDQLRADVYQALPLLDVFPFLDTDRLDFSARLGSHHRDFGKGDGTSEFDLGGYCSEAQRQDAHCYGGGSKGLFLLRVGRRKGEEDEERDDHPCFHIAGSI